MDENLKNLIIAINADKKRGVSNSKSIKFHLAELENVLSSGIPLKMFVEDLNGSGFKCAYKTAQSILYWSRKARKEQTIKINDSPVFSYEKKTDTPQNEIIEDKKGDTIPPKQEQTAPARRMTLKEIQEETAREYRENKRPLLFQPGQPRY